ncbi:MAG: PEP-CTERM sorting domain-containing protein [Planctomycetota bacterium]|nr:PEP-CTERM sorting domain-containing protein [Planctomycetota bacterium]
MFKSMLGRFAALIALAALALPLPALAATAQVDLGPATVSSGAAHFAVSVLFTGAPGDQIEAVQLSVTGSSADLTAGGTDFSRFSFDIDAATLPGWIELLSVNTGLGLIAPNDPVLGPFLLPGGASQHIGTLNVSLAGLPSGGTPIVSLGGGDPGLTTDVGGTIGGSLVPSFAGSTAHTVSLGQPDGVAIPPSTNVPEPASAAMTLLLAGALLARRRVVR